MPNVSDFASESNVSAHITSPGQGLQRGVTLFISDAKLRNHVPRLFWIWYATERKIKPAFIFLTKTLTLTITLSTKHRNKLFSCNLIKVISLKKLYISIHSGTDLYQKKYMYVPNAVHTCTFLLTFQFLYFQFSIAAGSQRQRFRPCIRMASRFAKIFKYQPHLVAGEVAWSASVACALQRRQQALGLMQVLVEQSECRSTRSAGAV